VRHESLQRISEAGRQPEFLYAGANFCTPANEGLHPSDRREADRREGLSYLLGAIVRHHSSHFPIR
jgi:hypothetical protein